MSFKATEIESEVHLDSNEWRFSNAKLTIRFENCKDQPKLVYVEKQKNVMKQSIIIQQNSKF